MLLSILNDPVRESTEEHRARLAETAFPAPAEPAPEEILEEVAAIRSALGKIRFVISTHPEIMAPLKGDPLTYTLDSADPEKLKAIVDSMQHRAREPIANLLPGTLVLGHNYAAEQLKFVYEKFGIESALHFRNTDAGRAVLYQLALANKDLKQWLTPSDDRSDIAHLAAFLQSQIAEGRDKITLLMPDEWAAIAPWTRRAFAGLHVVTGEKPNLRNYAKDRTILVIQRKGEQHPETAAIKALRNAGYPIAALTFNATAPLSRYMRVMQATAFALSKPAPPAAEAIAIQDPLNHPLWKQLHASPESPKSLGNAISYGAKTEAFVCGEIAFFGDLRYHEDAPAVRKALDNAARLLFRAPLRMPATVCEAPSGLLENNADSFSILIMPAVQNRFALAAYEPDRHIAEFLETKLRYDRQRRPSRAMLVKDLSLESAAALEEFFSLAAESVSPDKHGQIQSR